MKIEEYLSTLPKSIISGEEIQIPASKQPKFKAGAPLKSAVNS